MQPVKADLSSKEEKTMAEEEKVLTPEAPKAEEVKEAAKEEAAPERKEGRPHGDRGPRRDGRRDQRRPRAEEPKEFEETVVDINRIAKTVKGGRKLLFAFAYRTPFLGIQKSRRRDGFLFILILLIFFIKEGIDTGGKRKLFSVAVKDLFGIP